MRNIFLLILLVLFILPTISISGTPATHSPASNNIRYEVRAAWLTTLMGLDWPSKPATTEAQAELQRRDLCRQLDQLKAAGINMVLFQSRIRSTTAYASDIEPWDGVFTGCPGQRPLYDPLLFAINECHKRGMECHAWVVAFPICKVATAKQLGKRALPVLHPELCQRCGDQWMMNPGVPATATYLANVCKEIVTKYAVDGIHLDYIRYPEASIPFNDNATYRRYGQGLNKATWRTQNIDRCVQAIHKAVKKIRPWVKLSCSPVGKYADLSRYSSRGWNARDAVSQDAQRWLCEGWMDMLFPMMYFDGDHFYPFLANWKENDFGRPIVPGLGIYFLNEREKNWPLLTIQRQMNVSRDEGLGGQAFFRTRFLLNNEKGLRSWLQTQFYAQPALIPPMTWQDSIPPTTPLHATKHFKEQHISLSWSASTDNTPNAPLTYNVYRIDSLFGDVILALHTSTLHYEHTLSLPALRHSHYLITAVDAYGNESQPIEAIEN